MREEAKDATSDQITRERDQSVKLLHKVVLDLDWIEMVHYWRHISQESIAVAARASLTNNNFIEE